MFMLCLGMGAQTETSLIEAYQIYVTAENGQTGSSAELILNMKNRNAIRLWECKLYLPEGIAFQSVALTDLDSRYSNYTPELVATPNNDGSITIHCEGEEGEVLAGTDGAVAVVTVDIPSTFTPGNYDVNVKDMKIEEPNGSIHTYKPEGNNFTWTIEQGAVTTATITFIDEDGTVLYTISQEVGSEVDASEVPVPTKEGYTFDGWDSVIPDVMPEQDLTIRAQWVLNSWLVVFLDEVDGVTLKSETVNYGETITPPEEPQREGYNFAGWYPEIPETMPDSAMTFVAQWEAIYYRTIFYLDEGGEPYYDTRIAFGDDLDVPDEPAREGYTFVGWDPEIPGAMPAHDMTFVAQWQINSWTLTFVVDNEVWETRTVEFGTKLTPPENEPTLEGYTFSGWIDMPPTMPDYDLTIQGFFTINTHTVTYLLDETGAIYEQYEDVAYGNDVPEPADNPTREGYTFIGWTPDNPGEMPDNDLTFMAQWEILKFNVEVLGDYADYVTVSNLNPEYGETVTITVDVDALPDYEFVALMFEEENGNGPYNVIDMMEGNTFTVEKVSFNFAVEAVFNPLFEMITLTQAFTPFSSVNNLDFANSDLKAYVVTRYDKDINYAVMEEVEMVPACTGVMLVGEVGVEYKIPFILKQIPPVEVNLLQPFLEEGWLTAWGDPFEDDVTESVNYVYDAAANKFFMPTGNGAEMPAKSAYLQLRGSDAADEFVRVCILDTSDGIADVQKSGSENAIYDMQGRRVSKAVKGLYIINGKKVAVK